MHFGEKSYALSGLDVEVKEEERKVKGDLIFLS